MVTDDMPFFQGRMVRGLGVPAVIFERGGRAEYYYRGLTLSTVRREAGLSSVQAENKWSMLSEILKLVLTGVGLAVVIGCLMVWSGVYDISATEPHYAVTKWFLSVARDRAIAVRTNGMRPPSDWPGDVNYLKGFQSYHEMCEGCHSAPGLDESVVRIGLNPAPPKRNEEKTQVRRDVELFWIVKHGIKMSGMPAFGPTHSDRELWEIIAFLRRLPKLNGEDYKDLLEEAGFSVPSGTHVHADFRVHDGSETKGPGG